MEENIKQINEALARVSRSERILGAISGACHVLGLDALESATGGAVEELGIARIDLEQVRYRLNEARNVTL